MTGPEPTRGPTPIRTIKEYFGKDREVSNGELLAFKRAYPDGLKQLAEGIRNGSLTY
jgi:hypothetical protein